MSDTVEMLREKLKTAQDLYICIIVWSVLAMLIGLAAQHAHSSPSTKYEVNIREIPDSAQVINYHLPGEREER